MTVTSRVAPYKGVPTLLINGKPLPDMAYITYFTDQNRYADFAAAGYRLFSMPVMCASQTINEVSRTPVFSGGIFDGDVPDFRVFDENIAKILDACPEAYIFPRVNVSVSKAWEDAHPDELNDSGPAAHPESRRADFASDAWAAEVKRMLTELLVHVQTLPCRDSIIGWQISCGNTEEWFPFDMSGKGGKRTKEAYAAYLKASGKDDTEAAFFRFISEMTAARIGEFAHHVKELTENRLVVGTFYGYTFECVRRSTAHHALGKLLACGDIDFICSPISYLNYRAPAADNPYMLPVDSLRMHGKLYFSENDSRTHLSRAPFDIPAYNTPIWFGYDKQTTGELLKMHFARALIRPHACWWFDMWGGWFADEDYMALMQRFLDIKREETDEPSPLAAEVGFFVDEEAYDTFEPDAAENDFYMKARLPLGQMGLPAALYLASDFDAAADKLKVVITLIPRDTAASEHIKAVCKTRGTAYTEIRFNDMPDAKTLRQFCRNAGCHVYTDEDAVVFANARYVFIHTVSDGVLHIHVPNGQKLYDLFGERELPDTLSCPRGTSMLCRLCGEN